MQALKACLKPMLKEKLGLALKKKSYQTSKKTLDIRVGSGMMYHHRFVL